MAVRRPARGLAWADVVRLARALPDVEEGTSYGTPALHVRKKFLARLKEDGETLVLKLAFVERDHLLQREPATYFITDHYRDYPSVLVRLPNASADELAGLLESAWRRMASKRAVAAYDARA
jgi:hypothetical protein